MCSNCSLFYLKKTLPTTHHRVKPATAHCPCKLHSTVLHYAYYTITVTFTARVQPIAGSGQLLPRHLTSRLTELCSENRKSYSSHNELLVRTKDRCFWCWAHVLHVSHSRHRSACRADVKYDSPIRYPIKYPLLGVFWTTPSTDRQTDQHNRVRSTPLPRWLLVIHHVCHSDVITAALNRPLRRVLQ